MVPPSHAFVCMQRLGAMPVTLPPEILSAALAFLPEESKIVCAGLCTSWRTELMRDVYWEERKARSARSFDPAKPYFFHARRLWNVDVAPTRQSLLVAKDCLSDACRRNRPVVVVWLDKHYSLY